LITAAHILYDFRISKSAEYSTVERGFLGPAFKSSTVCLLRHLSIVLGLIPKRHQALSSLSGYFVLLRRFFAVVVALPCSTCPIIPPSSAMINPYQKYTELYI